MTKKLDMQEVILPGATWLLNKLSTDDQAEPGQYGHMKTDGGETNGQRTRKN